LGGPTKHHAWLTPDAITPTFDRGRRLFIPAEFVQAVSGALEQLTEVYNWEAFGDITPAQAAEFMREMVDRYYESENDMLGTIVPYATATPPPNILECDGSIHPRTTYPELYAVLDPAFQISADFLRLPDFRGRAIIGAGQGLSLTNRPVNAQIGFETHTLVQNEMPNHNHSEITAVATLINGGLEAPASSAIPGVANTGQRGGGAAHNNMQPSRAIRIGIYYR
jgi:microcystin-dependent protein